MNDLGRVECAFSIIGTIWAVIGMVIAILVVGHFLLGAVAGVREMLVLDPRSNSPVYTKFPDKVDFWKEHLEAENTHHFEPYYHWRRDAFKGEFTNVDSDGVRLTVKSPEPGATKVFMFGGAGMWGSGAPDKHTIPSILQSLLGDDYDVYNFGETGYVSTQELNYLLYLLANKKVPDVVIFYDGVNDGYAGAYSPAIPRDPLGLRARFGRAVEAQPRGKWSRACARSCAPRSLPER